MSPCTVIFACVHNAGRSQMAAAFFDLLADPSRARALSAGTQPGERIHPEVLEAMREVGVDLSGARPRRLTDELARGAAWLVTLGCGEACPHVPGLRRDDWPLEDPKGRSVERVREIRDEVRTRVQRFLAREGWAAELRLRPAARDDLPALRALLAGAGLPVEGIAEHLADFLVAESPVDGAVVGAGGLEVHGEGREVAALLRSLVVAPAWQGAGLGRQLVEALVARARARGLPALFLLTTTAERYFPRLGFVVTPRAEVPEALRASAELQGACPASAVVMRLAL